MSRGTDHDPKRAGMLVDPTNRAEIRAAILETLQRRERRVPDGLEYFSFENFAERANAMIKVFASSSV